jgi:DNA-binding Lrp family transcriptional regulator
MAVDLDEIDLRLLTELQYDADRTNLELAKVVELSPAATLHRIRRLKETGVIQVIRASVDPIAAGLPLSVFVGVTLARHDAAGVKRFIAEVVALPQVIAATDVAGEMDYWLTVVAKDIADLEHVLARLSTRGGQRLTTYLRLREIKQPSPLPLVTTNSRPRRR